MNIIGHLAIGITGSLITNNWLFLIGSILPDIALIANEIKLLITNNKFNKFDVSFKLLYDLSHSLYMLIGLYFLPISLSIGYLIHILIDIPFHSSSFRWKPFLFNRWKCKRRAVLLSGGMDSVAATLIEFDKDIDLIYFNYGQVYHHLEYPHAELLANKLNKELIIINRNWGTDIENRNYYLISEIKKLGYDEVIIGTRNILPIFDKYKDSNWFNLKVYQYLIGIYINTPIIGLFKFQIRSIINKRATYFSTEKYKENYE